MRIHSGEESVRKLTNSYELILWFLGPACLLLPIASPTCLSHVVVSLFLVTVDDDMTSSFTFIVKEAQELF